MAAIELDLTNPINVVRAMVGDVNSQDYIMSDGMYQQILDIYAAKPTEDLQVWWSSIYAAKIIKAHYAPKSMRNRERVNAVEIEEYGSERYENYCNLLDWLKRNPPESSIAEGSALFHFGGTYTECSQISTLKYVNQCLCHCWGKIWENGYYMDCPVGYKYEAV